MLKDSLAYAFSYLQWLCVGPHLYEGGDEKREEGKHNFPETLRDAEGGVCVCVRERETRTSSPLFG